MLIYLIGFMGCGKSKLGKQLAKKMKYQFLDFDEVIEEQSGKRITEIFTNDGQDSFRNIEKEILQSISQYQDTVVSAGGGTPCFFDNMKLMNETGITVYIRMTAGSLFHRLAESKTERPLIAGLTDIKLMSFIETTLTEREFFYMQAQHVVRGENLKAENILELINI